MGRYKLRAALLAAVLLAALFTGAAAPPESAPSGRWYGFRVEIAGERLTFPLEKAPGWAPLFGPGETLEPGQYADAPYSTGAGGVTLRLVNTTDAALPAARCMAAGLVWSAESGGAAAPLLPGGVGPGAAQADVLAAWGEPQAESGGLWRYEAGRHAYIELRFEGGALCGVELMRLERGAEIPKEDALPAEVRAYAPPAALNGDVWSYGIDYGGELYTLPAPVAAFLANDWQLYDGEGLTVEPGGWLSGVSLCRGELRLRTTLYNLSAAPQPPSGCFVVMAESSQSSMPLPLALANGLSERSSYEEAEALMGPPHETDSDINVRSYTWHGENGRVVARFAREDGAPYDLEIWAYG